MQLIFFASAGFGNDCNLLWRPIFQVKTLPASPCVSMSVRLLDSSSPAVSTHRGIISGQSGTAVCRTPNVVRLVFETPLFFKLLSNIKDHFYYFLVAESGEPPTPHYNSSVLGDLLPRAHLQFLSAVSSQCSAFADGVALLKVWLRQRELDQVGGLK